MFLYSDILLSFLGNHTIAVIKGSEDYETLMSGHRNVYQTVNELIDQGHIIIDGKKVNSTLPSGRGLQSKQIHFMKYFNIIEHENVLEMHNNPFCCSN